MVDAKEPRRRLSAALGMGLALTVLTAAFAPEDDCQGRFLGAWDYRQRAGNGYDLEGERIELTCGGGSMQGVYFGLEREGEHGLFYTLVEVADLSLSSSGELAFTVPERDLFQTRPKDLRAVKQKRLMPAGFTRDELQMRGRLQEGKLVLACTSSGHSCPEDVMAFSKDK